MYIGKKDDLYHKKIVVAWIISLLIFIKANCINFF